MDYLSISSLHDRPVFSILASVAVYGAILLVLRAVYRLFLHPLSAFPGPRLAATTSLWKAYYQCTGSFTHHLIDLHKIYGKRKCNARLRTSVLPIKYLIDPFRSCCSNTATRGMFLSCMLMLSVITIS